MLRKLLSAAALFVAPSFAHAEWHAATSKHFVVYSDDSEEQIRTFTERLERFDQALRALTGTSDRPLSPNMRVTVFMVSDVEAVRKLAGSQSIAGFYSARSWGPVAFVPRKSSGPLDARTILQHEYGHSFMFSTWPSVVFAKWFVEGFAEFVGTAFYRNDGSIVFGKPPEYRSYGMLSTMQMPAKQLLQLDPGKTDGLQTHVLYGRGWLLTHYSILGGHEKELAEYIRLSNEGKTAEAALAFGSYASLDAQLNAYAKRRSGSVVTLTKEQVPVGTISVRRMSAGEAAVMPAMLLSNRGVDEKAAPEVAALARRLAAPYSTDAAAQNELAEAEFDANNYAAAEAAADRALAADPKSIHALLYKGMAQMEIAKKAKDTDPGRWKAIRASFVEANRLDTEYPQPLILFYESFAAAKQKPTKSAENGLLYAYMLAPFDLGLRARAGRLLLDQGDVKSARVAFEPIAYSPHGGVLVERAKAILSALDGDGGATAALKLIVDAEEKAKKEVDAKKTPG